MSATSSNATPESTSNLASETLELKRVFAASIERVFDAWTKAEILVQWFGPVGFSILSADNDLTVGGQYKIIIQSPDKKQISHRGEYVEISAPNTLAFTWIIEDQACGGCEGVQAITLVSLAFKTVGDSTELVLTHEKLPSQAAVDGHQFGWQGSFDSLAALLTK